MNSTYDLYLKSTTRLAEAGFTLRKFVTNSEELRQKIESNEGLHSASTSTQTQDEDLSYANTSLGGCAAEAPEEIHKILGVAWDPMQDVLVFDLKEVARHIVSLQPTKRNVVGMTARFFDPLGVLSPVTVRFKMFFQTLCEEKIGWDDPFSEELLAKWNRLLKTLQGSTAISIPRCYNPLTFRSVQLVGFCDASVKAYAAVVYLRFEREDQVCTRFVAARTRVSPLVKITIPRLELLSALLLAKLITSVRLALELHIDIEDLLCFTDSKVSLYWIQGYGQEWKQFVENRVKTIRSLVAGSHWSHCPGADNPADIPSRGMNVEELSKSELWLDGPAWLMSISLGPTGLCQHDDESVPEECLPELKKS